MSWAAETNIKGPKGDKGDPGAAGAPGTPGATVNPATAIPLVEAGTGVVGTSVKYAREDHVHPLGPGGGGGSPVLSSDTPPVGAPDNALWLETDTGIMFFRWNDGNSTQWVAVPGGGAGVRYDVAQGLTAAQQVQARQNVYAAPFDALAYSGMQINGSMEVSQELGTTGRLTNGYICDGWLLSFGGTMALGASQSLYAGNFAGLPYILNVGVSTAQASMGAGDYVQIVQRIEGTRIRRLNWGYASASPITIGFWTAHHRTGVYSGVVENAAGTRSYAFTYTQSAADVPQYNTVTVPGCTDGVWVIDNTNALVLHFALAMGSTYTAPSANSWLVGDYAAAPGQINAVAATSDAFRLSGVVVLPGIEAPSAARSPLIMRPYDQELLTCQRYWQSNLVALDTWNANAGTAIVQAINYAPRMRASPVVAAGTPLFAGANFTGPTVGSSTASANSVAIQIVNIAAGRAYWYGPITADARL